MPDFNFWYPDSLHGTEVINVKDFGAEGDGLTDDTEAIQDAFDAAFGTKESPNGFAGRFNNRAVYFPPGNYPTTEVLYITGVVGGKIFGDAVENTTISFSPSDPGSGTYWRPGESDPKLTPAICMNGCSYFIVENMGFGHGGTAGSYPDGSCMFDICHIDDVGDSTMLEFRTVAVTGGQWCMRVGYQDDGVGNDNGFLYNVNFLSGDIAGLQLMSPSALNWSVIGGGASGCSITFEELLPIEFPGVEFAVSTSTFVPGGDPGNYGAGYSIVEGQISLLFAMSNSQNGWDLINAGGYSISIQSGSSESPQVFAASNESVISAGNVAARLNNPVCRFIDAQLGGLIHAYACVFTPPNAETGYVGNVGSTGRIINDVCQRGGVGLGESLGYNGSPGGYIWLRGDRPAASGENNFTDYTGQVVQHIPDPATILSAMPAAAKFRGLVRIIADATSSVAGTNVTGGGAVKVFAYCTGNAWRVIGPAV